MQHLDGSGAWPCYIQDARFLKVKGVHTVGEKGYFRHLRDRKTHCYTNADKRLLPIPSHLSSLHKIDLLISEIFETSNYEILIGNMYEFSSYLLNKVSLL
jgi:hypothetical protein